MESLKVHAKNLEATLLFVDFSKAFDSIHRGKTEQILLAYGFPKWTFTALMMLYQITKAMVPSPDSNTDFFDIVAGVLQGDILVSYMFITCIDYVLQMLIDLVKENSFTLKTCKDYVLQMLIDLVKENSFTLKTCKDYVLQILIDLVKENSFTLKTCRDYYRCRIHRWSSTSFHHHHHHHVVPLAQISLILSRHFSLSFIASGRSSGLHPVSSHSCCMYVLAGCPAFARPYVGVHRSTSLMSLSLLLQQYPACLVRLTWVVFVMGGRWPYS